ncbi:cob(I)yrinic acid a,c-diamide adenosyltransferase [Pectobacterium polaris]|uniref:cob(I)yrinic acid a,c-diamide adenosyltransferase n=1 Tax=Pectobacterium polaris TaxID=2042057 RepID=UPI000E7726DC|nr:cob(I)yrinic acid a,c-diamide adenosyltransferase [Pectobacterium polaris]MDE8741278.1 cob(I)yrinic acid a,c-diamide adenosyltransferase [Pectobacterium polaris]RJL24673.1 cob(I)yrinic acid a,c-diamide adenosyltransferase [Pectobacterium polaris]
MSDERHQQRHQQRQQRLKEKVDARIAAANETRGILIVFTGNGKGKTTAAFGTVTRAIGHELRAGVIQFIKGEWPNGEKNLLQQHGVEFQVMATGFTWDTQNRQTDTEAAQHVWQHGKRMLTDPQLDLVVLDELTYMISYDYLDLSDVVTALKQRPAGQTVIITGRGCHRDLLEMADTVTEMRPVKHAFDNGIQAQQGIDW